MSKYDKFETIQERIDERDARRGRSRSPHMKQRPYTAALDNLDAGYPKFTSPTTNTTSMKPPKSAQSLSPISRLTNANNTTAVSQSVDFSTLITSNNNEKVEKVSRIQEISSEIADITISPTENPCAEADVKVAPAEDAGGLDVSTVTSVVSKTPSKSIAVTCKSALVEPVVKSPMMISYPSDCVILIPALSDVKAAVIPVEPETAFIASFIAVRSVTDVIVAVICDVVELLPCSVKL